MITTCKTSPKRSQIPHAFISIKLKKYSKNPFKLNTRRRKGEGERIALKIYKELGKREREKKKTKQKSIK